MKQENKMNRKLIFVIMLIYILVFFFNLYSQDSKTLFFNAIKKQQSFIPKTFTCRISSSIFNDFFKQLPADAFTKKIEDLVFLLVVDDGKISVKIDGLKPEYNDFALSYFSIYTDLLSYVFISGDELTKQFENFKITYEKNTFTLQDDSELVSYNFVFTNDLLTTILFSQDNIKKMEINISYFAFKNYQLVKTVNIINFDENGVKKDIVIINFSKYQL